MKSFLKNKAAGFYFLVVACVLAVVSFVYYITWAQGLSAVSSVIAAGLLAGIAVNVLLLFFDNDFLVIALTVLYGVAVSQLLVDSVGSFADALQGIVMFGDPTQVGTIISISMLILCGVVMAIISGFTKRVKA